jgi:hypothetical protein
MYSVQSCTNRGCLDAEVAILSVDARDRLPWLLPGLVGGASGWPLRRTESHEDRERRATPGVSGPEIWDGGALQVSLQQQTWGFRASVRLPPSDYCTGRAEGSLGCA